MASNIVFSRDDKAYISVPDKFGIKHYRQIEDGDAQYFIDLAPGFAEKLNATAQEIAQILNTKILQGPIKTLVRAEKKAATKDEGARDIFDYVRATVLIQNPAQAMEAQKLMTPKLGADKPIEFAGNRLIAFEDNFSEPMANGLRRLATIFEMEHDGHVHVGELQFRVAEMMLGGVEDATHQAYQLRRYFDDATRHPTAQFNHKIANKFQKMAKSFGDIIKPLHDTVAQSLGYDALITAPFYKTSSLNKKRNKAWKMFNDKLDPEVKAQFAHIFKLDN